MHDRAIQSQFCGRGYPVLVTIDRIGEMIRTWTLLVEPTERPL